MFRRKLYTLAALLLLFTLFAGPALYAVGPAGAASDGSPTVSTTTTAEDPTGTTEHSPDMDPDGLVAATPDAGAGTLFTWIERIFAVFVGGIV